MCSDYVTTYMVSYDCINLACYSTHYVGVVFCGNYVYRYDINVKMFVLRLHLIFFM